MVPAFNESENIAPLLARIHEALEGKGLSYEVIIVDDGSTDATFGQLQAAQETDPALDAQPESPGSRGEDSVSRMDLPPGPGSESSGI